NLPVGLCQERGGGGNDVGLLDLTVRCHRPDAQTVTIAVHAVQPWNQRQVDQGRRRKEALFAHDLDGRPAAQRLTGGIVDEQADRLVELGGTKNAGHGYVAATSGVVAVARRIRSRRANSASMSRALRRKSGSPRRPSLPRSATSSVYDTTVSATSSA